MDGSWNEAKSVGRVKTATLMGDADPDQVYDTCKGCGECMHLNKGGYCGTEECSQAMFERAQAAGLTMQVGPLTVYNRDVVGNMRTPPVPEHTRDELRRRGLITDALPECADPDCTTIPRPDDALCIRHRMEANVQEHRSRRKGHSYASPGDDDRTRGRKQRRTNTHNKIKGLDSIKLK